MRATRAPLRGVGRRDLRPTPARRVDHAVSERPGGFTYVLRIISCASSAGSRRWTASGAISVGQTNSAIRLSSRRERPMWTSAPRGPRSPRAGTSRAYVPRRAGRPRDQEPERVHVVAVPRPRDPPRLLDRQGLGHDGPVEHRILGQRGADRGETGPVAEDLRSVTPPCRIPASNATRAHRGRGARDRPGRADRGLRMPSYREDVHQRVALPRRSPRRVRVTAHRSTTRRPSIVTATAARSRRGARSWPRTRSGRP